MSSVACQEFERSVETLRAHGLCVLVFDKANYPALCTVDMPDAVFPNNHFSTWGSGEVTAYPMRWPGRECEKR